MDKLITGIIIVAVVAFFYWLYETGGEMGQEQVSEQMDVSESAESEAAPQGPWVAIVGTGEEAHVAGHYNSYAECYQDVGTKVDVNETPYSCTNQ